MVRGRSHARAAVAAVGHIGEIADLAISQVHFDINQEQLARDGAKDERVSSSGADLADADNCDPRNWLDVSRRHFRDQFEFLRSRGRC